MFDCALLYGPISTIMCGPDRRERFERRSKEPDGLMNHRGVGMNLRGSLRQKPMVQSGPGRTIRSEKRRDPIKRLGCCDWEIGGGLSLQRRTMGTTKSQGRFHRLVRCVSLSRGWSKSGPCVHMCKPNESSRLLLSTCLQIYRNVKLTTRTQAATCPLSTLLRRVGADPKAPPSG